MIAKKLAFSMVFGQNLPGFAMTPDSIDYYPGCKPEDSSRPVEEASSQPPTQNYELSLYEDPKGLMGILRSEHGCQKIDDIVESEFALSFTAFAGSEGVEVFRYSLLLSDSTDQLVGFCCGVKPYFRSFMPLRGTILEH
jgi:hypothetical protein